MTLSLWSVLPRLRPLFICLSTISLLLSGCGYVGLEDELNANPDGLGGAESTGGQTTGGRGPGGGSSGGSEPESTGGGGSGSMGGSDSTGGTGGFDSGGGATAAPGYPCSIDCDDPYLLYRSFEIGVPVVPHLTAGAEVKRDQETVQSGQYSMRFSQGKAGSEARFSEAIRPVSSGPIYLRAWLFIPEGAATDWIKLMEFNAALSGGVDIRVSEGRFITSYSHGSRDDEMSEGKSYPVDSWFCLQVEVDVQDTDGSVRVWADGAPVLFHNNVDTRPGRGIDRLVYGLGVSGPLQTGASIYFDEILVSKEPVPCD